MVPSHAKLGIDVRHSASQRVKYLTQDSRAAMQCSSSRKVHGKLVNPEAVSHRLPAVTVAISVNSTSSEGEWSSPTLNRSFEQLTTVAKSESVALSVCTTRREAAIFLSNASNARGAYTFVKYPPDHLR